MEKLLLFCADDTESQKIRQIASRLRMRFERVDPTDEPRTLGEIDSGSPKDSAAGTPASSGCNPAAGDLDRLSSISSPALTESLLVMCHLSDKRMDKLLFELRRAGVALSYKAVLTPTNAGWTIPRLMLEMQREKSAYAQRKQ